MSEYKPNLKNILSGDEELKETEKSSFNGCTKCDSGYLSDGKICDCLKHEIKLRRLNNANIDYEFAMKDLFDEKIDAHLKDGKNAIKININNFIKQYVDNSHLNLKDGMGMLLNGGTGRGKSLTTMKTLMLLVEKGYSCYFITIKQILELIKQSWDDEDAKKKLNYIYNCDFLAIDDLGVEYHKEGSDWVLTEIDGLMRHRYFKKKPILITTNSPLEQLKAKYAQRIISLFHERLMFIAVTTKEDFREKNNKLPSYLNIDDLMEEN